MIWEAGRRDSLPAICSCLTLPACYTATIPYRHGHFILDLTFCPYAIPTPSDMPPTATIPPTPPTPTMPACHCLPPGRRRGGREEEGGEGEKRIKVAESDECSVGPGPGGGGQFWGSGETGVPTSLSHHLPTTYLPSPFRFIPFQYSYFPHNKCWR